MSLDIQSIKSHPAFNDKKVKKTAKIAGISAAVAGGLTALGGYGYQKIVLAHPDKYIKSLETHKEKLTKTCKETKEVIETQIKNCDETITTAKEFIKNGKPDYGRIVKSTLKNAGKAALVLGGVYFLVKTAQELITNKKFGKKHAPELEAVPTEQIVKETKKEDIQQPVEKTEIIKEEPKETAKETTKEVIKDTEALAGEPVKADEKADEKAETKTETKAEEEAKTEKEPAKEAEIPEMK